jgi:hypothetical protein
MKNNLCNSGFCCYSSVLPSAAPSSAEPSSPPAEGFNRSVNFEIVLHDENNGMKIIDKIAANIINFRKRTPLN